MQQFLRYVYYGFFSSSTWEQIGGTAEAKRNKATHISCAGNSFGYASITSEASETIEQYSSYVIKLSQAS